MKKKKKKRLSRSFGGDATLFVVLCILGTVMILPFIYAIVTAFKPNNELWIFPPRFYVSNPTLDNFRNLFKLLDTEWVPFSRYLFNTIFITVVGTVGQIAFSTLCAYPLACYKFPGSNGIFKTIQWALLFNGTATAIPLYIIITKLGLIDTYWALIIPTFGSTLGLYLMRQFMEQVIHPALLESAKIDGATELRICFQIVFPLVKPAWFTLAILCIQSLWNIGASQYLFTENLKTAVYAMSQISAAGISRTGVGAAVSVVMLLVPLSFFIYSQSNIVETMATSGMKD